jgi:hypothetical protein
MSANNSGLTRESDTFFRRQSRSPCLSSMASDRIQILSNGFVAICQNVTLSERSMTGYRSPQLLRSLVAMLPEARL